MEAKYYIVSYPLVDEDDVKRIKEDLRNNFIIVLRVTPLLEKGREKVYNVINDIYEYAISIGGDIARLGEDRVIVAPPGIKIWRELSRA